MQIIARKALSDFWTIHPRAEPSLEEWYSIVRKARWRGPAEVKAVFRSADFIRDNRVIFDIGGNRYRLVVRISYRYKVVQIKFIGTHAEYDRIDPESVG